MRAPIIEPKNLAQFVWDEGNSQVCSNYYNNNRYYIINNNIDDGNSEILYQEVQKNQKTLLLTLESLKNQQQLYSELPPIANCSATPTPNFSHKMDPGQQQRLMALLVQQQHQKLVEMKGYQAVLEQPQNLQNPTTMSNNFWLSLFATQNGTEPPDPLRNLSSPTTSPTTHPATGSGHQQSFLNFGLIAGIPNVHYLPAVVPPAAPLPGMLSTEEEQVAELASILIEGERQKLTDSVKQAWQNLTRHREISLSHLTTQHTLNKLVPSISPVLKRRVSESVEQPQQATDDAKMTTIKRAKVIVIEQKDVEPVPSCSANTSSTASPVERIERKQGKIEKHGNNSCGKRGNKDFVCNDDNGTKDHNNNGDDDDKNDDVQYVDVETVEEKLDTKEQRKALIEFYRKVKAVRVSYSREDLLMCQMCEEQVQNSDSLILMHLYGHAEVMPYRCKMCGAGECQLERMYAHIKQGHPNNNPSTTYENRRNMAQLLCLLRTCFPRNVTKTKAAYSDLIDKICRVVKEKSLTKLTCMVCTRKISTRKMCITRHAQTHLHYRCKDCGIILFGDTTIVEHSTKKHDIVDPQCTINFDACANTSDKTEAALRNCFSNILNENP